MGNAFTVSGIQCLNLAGKKNKQTKTQTARERTRLNRDQRSFNYNQYLKYTVNSSFKRYEEYLLDNVQMVI